jgi:ferredoxin, 2Fe-2S
MPTIHIATQQGKVHSIDLPVGRSILDACRKASLPIEGLCGGELDCSTCHVIVHSDWFARLEPASDGEEDMLDLIPTLSDTSRLGCQIRMTEALDGLKVKLP